MVLTLSTMQPLGSPAPDFALPDPSGRVHRLADFAGAPALLVMFICNHCPYVKHIRTGLAALTSEYIDRGAAIVGISSNDAEKYPDDAPDKMAEEAVAAGYGFPYLYDETQSVAHAYKAVCTPDFFLYDANHNLVYRGQFDQARPGKEVAVTGRDLRTALDAVLAGAPAPTDQLPSMGCNIKWKPGNEPAV
ncbi:MAG: thioredoxin family protein [Planctomycetia bacterium]